MVFYTELFIKTREYIKRNVSIKNIRRIQSIFSSIFARDLIKLAIINGSDKWGHHCYAKHYGTHFYGMRRKKLNLLEIGIGGYDDPIKGGNSLRMWKSFFSNSKIYGIDIFDKTQLQEARIKTFQGSQTDESFLNIVCNEIGSLDIVIDDGSHVNEDVIKTFELLFPRLNDGGIYIVEDMQTSYQPSLGGDNVNLNNKSTMINYFRDKIDCLNHECFIKDGLGASYFDKNISAMYFYKNFMLIYKAK
jgi:demethylmacrocin O-methyltransferase